MKWLENITTDRRKLLVVVALIFLLAAFLRFYNINWSFSNNGADEGIMLERARMVNAGFSLYKELPCDQAPLAFLLGSAFEGDVFSLRALTAGISLLAIAACMLASKKQRGNLSMLVTGILLTVDFALLRESRLFSLDGISASFLALSLPFFLHYLRFRSRPALVVSGLFVGLSTATKLFGGFALLGMLLFLLVEHWQTNKQTRRLPRTIADMVVVTVAAALPLAALMFVLGPSQMLDGMVFDQGHRAFDLVMKLSIPAFFAVNSGYLLPLVFARRTWTLSKESRFLLILTAVLLADFVLQPLVFLHHMVIMSPGLAILSGMFISKAYEDRKGGSEEISHASSSKKGGTPYTSFVAVMMVGLLVSAGLAAYGLVMQGKPSQLTYAEKIASWTTEDEWVISGDPLITSYAERHTPPGMVNVGTRIYPELTLAEVETAIVENDVAVFVLSYRFFEDDMAGLAQFLDDQGYEKVSSAFMGEWKVGAIDSSANDKTPLVFVRGDIIDAFDIPTESWSVSSSEAFCSA